MPYNLFGGAGMGKGKALCYVGKKDKFKVWFLVHALRGMLYQFALVEGEEKINLLKNIDIQLDKLENEIGYKPDK